MKKLAFWGASKFAINLLNKGFEKCVDVIIDNDSNKNGTEINGIRILHPDNIVEMSKYFIIITSMRYDEIKEDLIDRGMIENKDFIIHELLYDNNIEANVAINYIKKSVISNNKSDLICKVYNKSEYDNFIRNHNYVKEYEHSINELLQNTYSKRLLYNGECVVCGKKSKLMIDYLWSDGRNPAWTETCVCTKCNLNSRMRFLLEYLEQSEIDGKIYMYEYVTNLYRTVSKKFSNVIGSEYFGSKYSSGEFVGGIMHQDALSLSFKDESFDYMVSADVFEHVSDYRQSFKESYRCLKAGGKLIFSTPVYRNRYETITRAVIENGEIVYVKEPIYHGNPISNKGALVFFDFGWDILDELREIGFNEAYAVVYFSVEKAHFGNFPIIIEAVK